MGVARSFYEWAAEDRALWPGEVETKTEISDQPEQRYGHVRRLRDLSLGAFWLRALSDLSLPPKRRPIRDSQSKAHKGSVQLLPRTGSSFLMMSR